jgi:hypothetical protein
MRKSAWLVITVAITVVANGPAVAQTAWSFEARAVGMGSAVTAVADDSAAWLQNPAGLPYLRVSPDSRSSWPALVSGTTDLGADADTIGINGSACSTEDERGWGVGYWELGNYHFGPLITVSVDKVGAGYGAALRPGLSWGVSVTRIDLSWDIASMPAQTPGAMAAYSGDEIIVDLGAMYQRSAPAGKVKYGFVARDVADQMQYTFDVGASLQLPTGVLVAADIRDITDEVNTLFNVGAEWRPASLENWAFQAGSADGDLTYGAGYDFGTLALSVSRRHLTHDDVTAVTLVGEF